MPGDYPDPSVVKIGDTYWASATTSNWMPAYPILKSTDLINWQTVGNVFNKLPGWADFYFWAPEISYDNGKVYMYYAAHKTGGNLCVGVASADKPEGPYKDHGPLICQEVGSIDAFPIRDEQGKLHLVWKEDGNSVGKPTLIWVQEMNEERTLLLGVKKELFRNDLQWESNLVEGVSMMRHGEYLYAFYAAAACCGPGCSYTSGVARSKTLMGPWEKYSNNPVLKNEGVWKCPGHGTPIEKDGKFYFLYHAYDTAGTVYTGRQGLLKEFIFTADNWIKFIDEEVAVPVMQKKTDEFDDLSLHTDWQWSVFKNISSKITKGRIEIDAMPDGAYLGQKTYSTNYEATTRIYRKKSTSSAGIALIGDDKNLITALLKDNTIQLVQVKEGKDSVISAHSISGSRRGYLIMQVLNGKDITFSYSKKKRSFVQLNKTPVNGAYLPPWDRAPRVGIIAKGVGKAVFENFELNPNK